MASVSSSRLVHRLASRAFAIALVAVVLAFYGSMFAEKHLVHSPLSQARGDGGGPVAPQHWWERLIVQAETAVFGNRLEVVIRDLTARSRWAALTVQALAFFVPFVLGVTSAWLGGYTLTAIEQSGGTYAGNFAAVFAIMIGGFAAVIAGCMILSQYLWPWIPAAYN